MRRIVTISYTGLDAAGGVPKFNRDLHAAFPDREHAHFSWDDFPWRADVDSRGETEWGRAALLNRYLLHSRMVTSDDVVVADGFWATGLECLPLAVSHSHGIWSHLTKADVDAGKMPDMPFHHLAQVAFRRRWTDLGKRITAVSDFIADQMRLQWGFKVEAVINNGVDTDLFRPYDLPMLLNDLLIVHGVNDRGNVNKGWDHIELIKRMIPSAHVVSLDEAHALLNSRSSVPLSKPQSLSYADLFVHPSGYEGNSMMVAEALACGLPFVGYDVGFAYLLRKDETPVGKVMDRNFRSPAVTLASVQEVIETMDAKSCSETSRAVAVNQLSIDRFRREWRTYVEMIEKTPKREIPL